MKWRKQLLHHAGLVLLVWITTNYSLAQESKIQIIGYSNVVFSTAFGHAADEDQHELFEEHGGDHELTEKGTDISFPGLNLFLISQLSDQLIVQTELFFKIRENLRGVILLVDSRRVQDSDRDMMAWLNRFNIPIILVATKADKVPRGKRQGATRELQEGLRIDDEPIFLSAYTGEGKHQVLAQLRHLLGS